MHRVPVAMLFLRWNSGVIENPSENIFRQNMLDQHLAHVLNRHTQINRFSGRAEGTLVRPS